MPTSLGGNVVKTTGKILAPTRRTILKSSALLLLGGAVTRVSSAHGVEPTPQSAPPLPWKWVKLDPIEAGRRGYRAYLDKGG